MHACIQEMIKDSYSVSIIFRTNVVLSQPEWKKMGLILFAHTEKTLYSEVICSNEGIETESIS